MPSPDRGAQVIIGDRYGQSSAPWVTAEAVKIVASVSAWFAILERVRGARNKKSSRFPDFLLHALDRSQSHPGFG